LSIWEKLTLAALAFAAGPIEAKKSLNQFFSILSVLSILTIGNFLKLLIKIFGNINFYLLKEM